MGDISKIEKNGLCRIIKVIYFYTEIYGPCEKYQFLFSVLQNQQFLKRNANSRRIQKEKE